MGDQVGEKCSIGVWDGLLPISSVLPNSIFMRIFCTPQYILLAILLSLVLIIGGTMLWQGRTDQIRANDFDGGKWLLVGLSFVALISLGLFLAYTFSHAGGMGFLGC
jgi:hypothetical protein